MAKKQGVVRIKEESWIQLTKLAIDCSVALGIPINQATVLNAVLQKKVARLDTSQIEDAVKKYVNKHD